MVSTLDKFVCDTNRGQKTNDEDDSGRSETPTQSFTSNNAETIRVELTFVSVMRVPSTTMGALPLVHLKLSEEPLALQVRITVVLCSMASGTLDLMTTSETGSAGRNQQQRTA